MYDNYNEFVGLMIMEEIIWWSFEYTYDNDDNFSLVLVKSR